MLEHNEGAVFGPGVRLQFPRSERLGEEMVPELADKIYGARVFPVRACLVFPSDARNQVSDIVIPAALGEGVSRPLVQLAHPVHIGLLGQDDKDRPVDGGKFATRFRLPRGVFVHRDGEGGVALGNAFEQLIEEVF